MNEQIKYCQLCIVEYLNSGFTLFPCNDKKIPLIKGWNKLAFDNSERYIALLMVAGAYGVLLKEDDLVLDYDPRRDDIYLGQLKEFIKLLGYTTPLKTLIVSTARNGLHVYLKRHPSENRLPSYVPNFPAIEVKRQGHFVIGAGSIINGVQYKIVRR